MDNVFIGADCKILGGVRIGPNAVIGAGSIVTHDIPENSVAVGVPAKVIGSYDELRKKRAAQQQYPASLRPQGLAAGEALADHLWAELEKNHS